MTSMSLNGMNENDFLSTNKQSLPLYIIILISVGAGLFVIVLIVAVVCLINKNTSAEQYYYQEHAIAAPPTNAPLPLPNNDPNMFINDWQMQAPMTGVVSTTVLSPPVDSIPSSLISHENIALPPAPPSNRPLPTSPDIRVPPTAARPLPSMPPPLAAPHSPPSLFVSSTQPVTQPPMPVSTRPLPPFDAFGSPFQSQASAQVHQPLQQVALQQQPINQSQSQFDQQQQQQQHQQFDQQQTTQFHHEQTQQTIQPPSFEHQHQPQQQPQQQQQP
eukprot:CAMPEP_0168582520 /NCGR_PEP_ID=MMETSP0420-20121227/2026_1 /TAXON_ID=498008 /ORGANISM="Pessonella sp." /LENGTH=273 /DNA_ID=CAMNT_0008617013 /DNA_START=701 /DNA_END=1519 /DNA_ORIENTATION=+